MEKSRDNGLIKILFDGDNLQIGMRL